jgi:uncharacterized protein YdhG (YjbR/CyaY superfamily)
MDSSKVGSTSVDAYISAFPEATQKLLDQLRTTIRAAAPDAVEKISYQMPTFYLKGNLVHFAAYKRHIGLYPVPREVEEFKQELSAYDGEKSTVRFPLDRPLPLDLIRRIVEFRVAERLKSPDTAYRKRST